MITTKRTASDTGIGHGEPVAKRNSLGYDARTPWLQDSKPPPTWRTLGNRAVRPSLPLENMVAAVQDLIDPDFDPLIAILDEEPRFLKPLPSHISPEDLEFLRFRGALSIPESGLRNELLRCYIKWVHSFMPVLNLQDFLRCVAENDPNGNISLLLFQAVMFVATAFVDLKHLQDAGYATRKIARSAFYTRLRLLYSLDCEEDRIAILQTLLLMTYWTDHVNHPQRDIWDWIGVCNTQAHSIGLNRDPTTSPTMDLKTKRLRIRLWWSLYSRDRLISLGMRRPTQVNEGTSNVPMLRLDDFEYESFHPSVINMFHCRQLEDPSHQKRLATMFMEKAKLCQCIGRVLFAQYSPSQRLFGITNRTTITLAPRQASESELARCSQRLDSWVNSLPKDAQFIPASKTNFNDGEDVLLLHGAMVRMLYHATISALYRPWAYGSNKGQSKSRIELTNTARSKMHDAAIGITHIIQGLNQLNLTRFLPQSGVTVIIPATVLHLANSMSDNPTVREASIRNFHRCVQVLQGLKELYPAADMEVANIEAAVRVQSDSASTLLQIMQSNSINLSQPQPAEPYRRGSDVATIQTLSPSEDQTSEHWISPMEPEPANKPNNPSSEHPKPCPADQRSKRNSVVISTAANKTSASPSKAKPDYLTPTNDFDDHFNSAFNSHSPLPDPTFNPSSFLDIDSNNTEFPLFQPSSHPDIDIDWAEDFLRGADFKIDFSSSTLEDHSRDFFSFSDKQAESSNAPRKEEITGDLDKDLGLNSGDEMF
ncbi:fungal-specific transcription factor domain-containing protein [Aspergillus pseudotamarii]|uniref:Fungal-specific transcription factor domain-containing protein n=1 Tax=Aspergillus pseudotamarii TaxID=132259 RepID=A0A5N6SH02_ASPPS|nr:fungal-specific transcription factor domain-containing protein [Aspergillus pseudotamarii]KAE8133998.1 fungal-specific transcription factor domain-containing protein [Aspergillus pseudotamarii]